MQNTPGKGDKEMTTEYGLFGVEKWDDDRKGAVIKCNLVKDGKILKTRTQDDLEIVEEILMNGKYATWNKLISRLPLGDEYNIRVCLKEAL